MLIALKTLTRASRWSPKNPFQTSLRRAFSYLNFFDVDNTQIARFLKENNIDVKERSNANLVAKTCPLCPKPHNNVASNLWTLNFKGNSGAFLCFRCGISGSWADFVKALTVGGLPQEEEVPSPVENEKVQSFQMDRVEALQNTLELIRAEPNMNSLNETDVKNIQVTLRLTDPDIGRGLTPEVLTAYNVGLGHEMFKDSDGNFLSIPVVCFPFFPTSTKKSKKQAPLSVAKIKMRGIHKAHKQFMRIFPSGASFGLFGYNLIAEAPSVDALVITEGEFDAMAVYQATGIPAISLPFGASNMPPEMIFVLKKAKQIYLWMDFDEVGQLNVSSFAEKLGTTRTHIIKELTDDQIKSVLLSTKGPDMSPEAQAALMAKVEAVPDIKIKDANDALRLHPELVRQYINRSKSLPQLNIVRFNQLRTLVKERIFHQDRFRGVSSFFFPWFNTLVKGFRRGE
jgi:twinkle protein